jgi:hypothetical protein
MAEFNRQRDAYDARREVCRAAAESAQQQLLTVVQQCHSLQLSNAALNCGSQLASAIGLEQELQKLVASHPVQPVERSATLFLESSSFSRQLRHVRLRYADAGRSWRFDYFGRSLVVAVRVQVKEGPGKLHRVNADGSLGAHGESSIIFRVPESNSGQWLDVAIVPAPGFSAPISVEVQLMALNTGLLKALQGAAANMLPFVQPAEELQVRVVDVELMQVAIRPVTQSTGARCRRSRPAHSASQQEEQPTSLCGTLNSSP